VADIVPTGPELERALSGEAPLPMATRAALLVLLIDEGATLTTHQALALLAGVPAKAAAEGVVEAIRSGALSTGVGEETLSPTREELKERVTALEGALSRLLEAETKFEEAVGDGSWRTAALDESEPAVVEVVKALRAADELLGPRERKGANG